MNRLLRHIALCSVVAIVATLGFAVAPAGALQDGEASDTVPLSVVVKLVPGASLELDRLVTDFEATSIEPVLATRDIFRVRGEHSAYLDEKDELKFSDDGKKWVKEILKADDVLWGEIDLDISANDLRFHVWRFHVWQFDAAPHGDLLGAAPPPSALQPAFAELSLDQAHERATGAGIRIAVLDSGVDANHELLNGRLIGQYDLVDDDGDAAEQFNGVDDDHDGHIDEAYGHGTFVAGIIAQVAPDAEIYALRVIDDDGVAQLYALIEAIDMAIAMDVDIINMSFGLITADKIEALDDALKRAKKAGVVIVAAAGNEGEDRKSYPAAAKDVISVAAIEEASDSLAHFSSRGKWVEIAAPGVAITSSIPGGGYAEWAGTSMATPVVAGLGALLFEAAPENRRKAKEITKALYEGAREMEHKNDTHNGIIDFNASLDRILR